MGIGGGPEGVIAAAALDKLDCKFQGRFLFNSNEEVNRAKKMGIMDLNKKYEINEIVRGDSIFCATGITSCEFMNGIVKKNDKYVTETIFTDNKSVLQIVKKEISIT